MGASDCNCIWSAVETSCCYEQDGSRHCLCPCQVQTRMTVAYNLKCWPFPLCLIVYSYPIGFGQDMISHHVVGRRANFCFFIRICQLQLILNAEWHQMHIYYICCWQYRQAGRRTSVVTDWSLLAGIWYTICTAVDDHIQLPIMQLLSCRNCSGNNRLKSEK